LLQNTVCSTTRVKSAIVFSLMIDDLAFDCRIFGSAAGQDCQETRCHAGIKAQRAAAGKVPRAMLQCAASKTSSSRPQNPDKAYRLESASAKAL